MSPTIRTISADALKAWRLEHGMTQELLAEKIGVTRGAVRHWEKGRHPIGERVIRQIEAYCSVKKLDPPSIAIARW